VRKESVGVIHVTVNGRGADVERDARLAEMLRRLGIDGDAAGVAVAVNDAVVPRGAWAERSLEDGDVIEIIRAVQGG
jgi:sulfur carrier protein